MSAQKNRTEVKTNSKHAVQHDGIHDSEIKSLSIAEDGRALEIKLRTEAGNFFKIYLSGIRRLSCNDFRTQNVIFGMFAYNKTNVKTEMQNDKKRFELTDKDLDQLSKEIELGNLFLFQIDASIGCDISCICEKVEIEI